MCKHGGSPDTSHRELPSSLRDVHKNFRGPLHAAPEAASLTGIPSGFPSLEPSPLDQMKGCGAWRVRPGGMPPHRLPIPIAWGTIFPERQWHPAAAASLCVHTKQRTSRAPSIGAVAGVLTQIVSQLSHKDHRRAALAAQFIFERAHTSNPKSVENKQKIGRSRAIAAMCRLMDSPLDTTRFQACSALSELAFCNEDNCRAIIATPGCLESVVNLLQPANGSTQCDAALIINNCAAFCSETCPSIVHYPGMLDAIQGLALCGTSSAKNVSVGAINSISRCLAVRNVLVSAGIVEDTLAKVLCEEGSGEQYEARIARAAMAVANLQGHEVSSPQGVHNFHAALGSICKIMGFAIAEKSWAGIFFAPYSVCLPMYNLSLNAENRRYLVEQGMVELIAELLRTWKVGHHSDDTLSLALAIASQLLLLPDNDDQMALAREAALIEAVQVVAEGARGESEVGVGQARELLGELRDRHLALWMCQHTRVGAVSRLHQLDESVTEIIASMAMV